MLRKASSNPAGVNRIAGFPGGEPAYGLRGAGTCRRTGRSLCIPAPSGPQVQRGLAPARLRRITELVHAKIEEELTLHQMAQCVGLSTAHFSEMFRKFTG